MFLGTARQGRQSENVAKFVLSEMRKRPEIETELIDVRTLPMPGIPLFSATLEHQSCKSCLK
jgi:hypothetical protein